MIDGTTIVTLKKKSTTIEGKKKGRREQGGGEHRRFSFSRLDGVLGRFMSKGKHILLSTGRGKQGNRVAGGKRDPGNWQCVLEIFSLSCCIKEEGRKRSGDIRA